MNRPDVAAPRPLVYADDSESDRMIVSQLWSKVAGTPPVCVEDGEDLMAHLERCLAGEEIWPRLVLLDLNMPVMSGYEVLDAIKCDPRLRPLPVVVFSTSGQRADVERCYARRANGYLVKHIDVNALKRALERTHAFWFEHVVPPDMEKAGSTS